MKISKIISRLFFLTGVIAIISFVTNVSAQENSKCMATANQIYFVDSGQTVVDVHPGSNGGNGYQLNILGTGADNFEVVRARYMTVLYIIPGYTNSTQAKWELEFAANMGRMIPGVKLKNKCTGETREYRLTTKIRLLDQ